MKRPVGFLATLLLVVPVVAADETVDDLRAVHAAALQLAAEHGAAKVLVAVDIDNTLLAMDQDLGSDQWFDWQQGAMLLTLLGRSRQSYDAVVFVDDHERHVRSVVDACRGRSIPVRSFRYSREDARVRRFSEGDKCEVNRKWQLLRHALDEIFGPQTRKAG